MSRHASVFDWTARLAFSLFYASALSITADVRSAEPDPVHAGVKSALPDYDKIKKEVYATITAAEEKGFERMGTAKKGDWLARVKEPPETFDEYRAQEPARPTVERHTLVIQPLGAMNEHESRLLEMLKDYAEAFFEVPVRIEPVLELNATVKEVSLVREGPRDRYGHAENRYEALKINEHVLLAHMPADAMVYMGITAQDLWGNDGGVFGYASLDKRSGVCSLHRILPPFWEQKKEAEQIQYMRRACRLLSHECGHMLGLPHCVFYRCAMNGCQGLQEADATPLHFCPICERKLRWNLAYDPEKRAARLEEFYRKYGMTTEADWWREKSK